MPLVYHELRKLARHYLQRERPGHSLSSTALVNELYLRLVEDDRVDWNSRAHFFGIAARQMRRILVDHARRKQADKRGGGVAKVPFDSQVMTSDPDEDVLRLDQALEALGERDERQAKLVELKYFVGLSIEETARVLGVSSGTVKREWAFARAWLSREMQRRDAP